MSNKQPDWKKELFDVERDQQAAAIRRSREKTHVYDKPEVRDYVKRENGDWILFGPQDVRNSANEYHFALIYTTCDRTVRVRAGCRFKTIEQAWRHWGRRAKSRSDFSARQGRMCLVIIEFMLLKAQALGLLTWKQKRQRYTVQLPKQPKRKTR